MPTSTVFNEPANVGSSVQLGGDSMTRKDETTIRYTRGKGPGGRHRNCTDSCVVLTHGPTGIVVMHDGRNRHQNERAAFRELDRRLQQRKAEATAAAKKSQREYAIRNETRIRTYDYSRNVVTDHRTGKKASIKNVVDKGRIDLLWPA